MKILGTLFLIVSLTASCDNDNDPSDDNLFTGQYQGTVSYSDPDNGTDVSTEEGQVTVIKVGNSYTFDFSNDIPSLKDIEMEKNQNTLVTADGTIDIDESNLNIAYIKDGKTWGATCSR